MDTVKNFRENLQYQKQNFRDIYNGYFIYKHFDNAAEDEVALSKATKKKSDKILVLIDTFDDVLQKLFAITEYRMRKTIGYNLDRCINDYLKEIETISIEKSFDETQMEVIGDKMQIKCMFSYMVLNKKIVFTKAEVTKSILKNAEKIFSLKKLSVFEKHNLKEKKGIFTEVEKIEELKEELIRINFEYNFYEKISSLNNEIKKQKISINLFEGEYVCSTALDIINCIVKDNIIQNTNEKILKFINKKIYDLYNNEVKKLLQVYIKKDFYHNYIIVNSMIEERKKFNLGVNNFLSNILNQVESIKNLTSQTEKEIALLNSDIKNIDQLVIKSLQNLNKSINEII